MTRDSIVRSLRTFLYSFLGVLIPGVFGWLNSLTEWARDEGQRPLPDATSLAYLGVAAIAAGMIALVNLLANTIEDGLGRGVLRTPPQRAPGGQSGHSADAVTVAIVGLACVIGGAWINAVWLVVCGVVALVAALALAFLHR